jgi:rsbT co-antagonist protein RsbR
MMDTAGQHRKIAEFLRDNQEKLLPRWAELASSSGGYSSADALRSELSDIYELLIRAVSEADDSAAGELNAALGELSRSRAREGATPGETALSVFTLKDAVYELAGDAPDMVPVFLTFSRLIDNLGLHTFEVYAAAREQIITDQAESMLELSTPVVRLWDGIIAVPLVGTLDSARTQLVMEKMLEALVASGSDHAVIDITGVPTVDTKSPSTCSRPSRRRACSGPSAPSRASGRRSRTRSCRSASSSATSRPRRPWPTRWRTR